VKRTFPPLVLASASPRRRSLLAEAGYRFRVFDPGDAEAGADESGSLEDQAMAKARAKAERAVRAILSGAPPRLGLPRPPCLVVSADTLVAVGDEVLGKPADRADALRMLKRLSGTRHRVISGLCLWQVTEGASPAPPVLRAETTHVTMRATAEEELRAYVDTGEADGKAGAYAIQDTGDRFITKVEGSFSNVVGFPLELFQAQLAKAEPLAP
jgi:septum formation protein